MTPLRTFCFTVALLGTLGGRAIGDEPAKVERPTRETLLAWGDDALATIESTFRVEDDWWYVDKASTWRSKPSGQPVFMWGVGVQLSALAAAAENQPDRYRQQLTGYVDAIEHYWHKHQGIGGYDVLPHPEGSDRYYDDNAWIVLGMLETFEQTRSSKHLQKAKQIQDFVMSGEDPRLGGGIYWRENELLSKNTCSNAPAMVGALRLYEATHDRQYLEAGERLYAWTCKHLQDEDGLFWDNINLQGNIDRRKYSYNSALMIRANCALYRITEEQRYLDEAKRMAQAAEQQWVNAETGAMNDGGRFAHLLLDAFLELYKTTGDSHWLDVPLRAVTYVHDQLRDERGHYPGHWGRKPRRTASRIELIDQASVARAYEAVARAMPQP